MRSLVTTRYSHTVVFLTHSSLANYFIVLASSLFHSLRGFLSVSMSSQVAAGAFIAYRFDWTRVFIRYQSVSTSIRLGNHVRWKWFAEVFVFFAGCLEVNVAVFFSLLEWKTKGKCYCWVTYYRVKYPFESHLEYPLFVLYFVD